MQFEWDPSKSEANHVKHGIRFDEARELFESDADYLEIFDESHSGGEDRFIAIGPIGRGMLAVWTERFEDVVRIISARWATDREKQRYYLYMGTNDERTS